MRAKTHWRMSPHDRETPVPMSAHKLNYYSQLLICIQKYKTLLALRQHTWMALVDVPTSCLKQMFRGCWRQRNCDKTAGDRSAMRVCIHLLPPQSEQGIFRFWYCAKVTIKFCWFSGSCTQCAINSITGYTFWNPVTGWKAVHWLFSLPFNSPNLQLGLGIWLGLVIRCVGTDRVKLTNLT